MFDKVRISFNWMKRRTWNILIYSIEASVLFNSGKSLIILLVKSILVTFKENTTEPKYIMYKD